MAQLMMNYIQLTAMFQFIRGTYRVLVIVVFKSVNNINPHFMLDYFKMNFFPYGLMKGNKFHLPPAHLTRHRINSLLFRCSILWKNLPREIKESLSTERTEGTRSPSVFMCSL